MTTLRILVILPFLLAVGFSACVAGRMSLTRLADGSYRGSLAAWFGFIGGAFLTTLAVAAMVSVAIRGVPW
jgi:hypothetical protein